MNIDMYEHLYTCTLMVDVPFLVAGRGSTKDVVGEVFCRKHAFFISYTYTYTHVYIFIHMHICIHIL